MRAYRSVLHIILIIAIFANILYEIKLFIMKWQSTQSKLGRSRGLSLTDERMAYLMSQIDEVEQEIAKKQDELRTLRLQAGDLSSSVMESSVASSEPHRVLSEEFQSDTTSSCPDQEESRDIVVVAPMHGGNRVSSLSLPPSSLSSISNQSNGRNYSLDSTTTPVDRL
jgi:hypothetical protein